MRTRGRTVPGPSERWLRSEPFEVFTRPQRSLPARIAGLVVRLRAEITTGVLVVVVWVWLTNRLPTEGAAVLIGIVVAGVTLVPATRHYVTRRGLAVLTRHRLRAVFVERRVMNYTGNLPVLLWSRPIPVGERVWLVLRAGIDWHDVERNLTHIASGCFARDARVIVRPAITALVVVDVIRRDPLATSAPAAVRPLRLVPAQKGA
jgi:hypothetical protein